MTFRLLFEVVVDLCWLCLTLFKVFYFSLNKIDVFNDTSVMFRSLWGVTLNIEDAHGRSPPPPTKLQAPCGRPFNILVIVYGDQGAKIHAKTLKLFPKVFKRVQKHEEWGLGTFLAIIGAVGCQKAVAGQARWRFWAPFWRPKSIKILNFRHCFLDVFLYDIFDGFEMLLGIILEVFGRPNGP